MKWQRAKDVTENGNYICYYLDKNLKFVGPYYEIISDAYKINYINNSTLFRNYVFFGPITKEQIPENLLKELKQEMIVRDIIE